MDDLTECIRTFKYDGSEEDIIGHKAIYTHIEGRYANSSRRDECPPLDVIIYAARNILGPTLNISQIPDLLDLLTTVESFRKQAIYKADEALTFNAHWKSAGQPDEVLLAEEEEAFIEELVAQAANVRQAYLEVVQHLIQLDIHHLWTCDAPSIAKLAIRMNEYFPPTNKNYAKKPSLYFHGDFSDEERSSMDGMKRQTISFLKEAFGWALEKLQPNVCQPNTIQTCIPLTIEWLNRVEADIHELERIFSPASGEPS